MGIKLKLPKHTPYYIGAGIIALLLWKRAQGSPPPPPDPDPDPTPDVTLRYPFGISETNFGMSAEISATNLDGGEPGENTTEVRVNNLQSETIPVTLTFWIDPRGMRRDSPLVLLNVEGVGIRIRTRNITNNVDNQGLWTVTTFGSTDRTVTSSNYPGKQMQFLASDTFII